MAEESKFDLIPLLEYIDPSTLSYQEWCDVGFALKHEGYSASDWDRWSASDGRRYHSGECEKKWDTFKGTGSPVTGATITQLAKEGGWHSDYDPDDDTPLSWNDSFVAQAPTKGYRLLDSSWLEGTKIKKPKVWHPAEQIIEYLQTLFDPGEVIGFSNNPWEKKNNEGETEKWLPNEGIYTMTSGEIIDALRRNNGDIGSVMGDPNPQAGAWIRINPLDGKGVKNDNVVDYRYALVESDKGELEKQNEILHRLELPIATLTYSGNKSIHAIVKVNAQNYEQYKQRVDYLFKVMESNGLIVDKQNKNPSRLSRLPGFQRGQEKQFLIDTNIGQDTWEEWEEYIEDLNDNLPDLENMADLFDKEIELAPELIKGMLRQGHKLLISGPSKAGKSFALIQLAIAIAEGWKWFGFQCVQGKVLYVNLELDERSAKKRFVDIYNTIGKGHENVDNIDVWNLRGKTSPMDKLAPKLIRKAQKIGYMAVIIDPIYKVLTGDENSAHEMANFTNQFDKIATELGCAVIYCHHHSKGSQGGKNSMDRSSGSGVFARDPDAILDLIELPAGEERYNQLKREAICGMYNKAIKHFNPNYDKVGLDDQFSEKQMVIHLHQALDQLPNKDQVFSFIDQQKDIAVEQVEHETAWRLEGTLREFAGFKPINAWFKYPVHVLDDSLADIELEDNSNPKKKWKQGVQKNNQSRSEKTKQELEEAFNVMSDHGNAVDLNQIANYLEVTKKTVYGRVKKHEGFHVIDGMVEKTNANDNQK